jgi:hypothetical protein
LAWCWYLGRDNSRHSGWTETVYRQTMNRNQPDREKCWMRCRSALAALAPRLTVDFGCPLTLGDRSAPHLRLVRCALVLTRSSRSFRACGRPLPIAVRLSSALFKKHQNMLTVTVHLRFSDWWQWRISRRVAEGWGWGSGWGSGSGWRRFRSIVFCLIHGVMSLFTEPWADQVPPFSREASADGPLGSFVLQRFLCQMNDLSEIARAVIRIVVSFFW